MTRSGADQNLFDRARALGCLPPPFAREDDPKRFAEWDSAICKLHAASREQDTCVRRVSAARAEADRIAGHSEAGPNAGGSKPFVMPFDPLASIAALFGVA